MGHKDLEILSEYENGLTNRWLKLNLVLFRVLDIDGGIKTGCFSIKRTTFWSILMTLGTLFVVGLLSYQNAHNGIDYTLVFPLVAGVFILALFINTTWCCVRLLLFVQKIKELNSNSGYSPNKAKVEHKFSCFMHRLWVLRNREKRFKRSTNNKDNKRPLDKLRRR